MILNKINVKNIVASIFVAGSFFGTVTAHAQVTFGSLPIGGFVTYGSLTTIGGLPGGFSQFGATQSALYAGSNAGNTINGSLVSAVFANGSELIFAYQIQTTTGTSITGDFSVAGFGGRSLTYAATTNTDIDGAGTLTSAITSTPDHDFRSNAGDSGNSVTFAVASQLNSNQRGPIFMLRMAGNTSDIITNGGAAVLGGGVSANTSANVITTVPLVTGVGPEPGTLVLAGLGIAGLALRRRRH